MTYPPPRRLRAFFVPLLALVFVVVVVFASAPARAAEQPTTKPVDASQLRVPAGFIVERVAAPPLVEHPMCAGFDDRGRLFVAESGGVNANFHELRANPPSKVLMLEDSDGDGTFDKRTVFADKMTFPTGVLWLNGSLYVCSAPSLWKLTDTNNDGVADKREAIVSGFGSVGNGADLHGPFLGPEGWLYFTDGRNSHDVRLGDGTPWKGKAAAVYRCRSDGSGLEVVCGGGMDNPVEVVFTPEGEPLVNVNLIQAQPHRVDAIIYAIEGSNYPYNETWKELKRTGEFQPTIGDLGWVATSGFMRYTGSALGAKYAGKYFSTQFNPHRVQAHTVTREGAGFRVTHEDALTCDNPDFHPTDILEDAKGELLVVDTGGWFRIGCPNSQIAKPDIKGAIYRVRRDPKIDHDETASPPAVNQELQSLRQAVLAANSHSMATFVNGLNSADLAIRRESATGLGRLRAREAAAPLLNAAADTGGDRFLQHAIIYALIRIADRDATIAGLSHKDPAARRSALVALDQMNGGNLTADLVSPHLASDVTALRDAALSAAAAHPQWADQLAPRIRAALTAGDVSEQAAPALAAAVTAFARAPSVQQVVADVLGAGATSPPARLLLLGALKRAGVNPLPDAWAEPIRRSLRSDDSTIVSEAIDLVGGGKFDTELAEIAHAAQRPIAVRVAALASLLTRVKAVAPEDFELLKGQLASDQSPLSRLAAAQALAAAPLNEQQLAQLAETVGHAGPLELSSLLRAFERSADPGVGAALVKSLRSSKSLTSLTPAGLTAALAKFPADVRSSATDLVEKVNPDAELQAAKLKELEPLLTGGSPNRGQSVFFSKTATCSTCHAVGGNGAHVGPDLSHIASIRSPRDLLESVVFPSASFARGYESFIVQTKSNQVLAGVVAAETADAITLRTPAETRVPRASIKTMRQDRLSIMPQGLDAQMSKQELSDLLAFLQTLK
jgi:putative membrane-bound dehydrogenase-like protein